MSKVNNNNQQITAIKRVITARDNRDKKKNCSLTNLLEREGGGKGVWRRVCYNHKSKNMLYLIETA